MSAGNPGQNVYVHAVFSSLIEVALVLHEQYHIAVVSRLISDGHFFFRGNPISITDIESCCQKN